MRKLLVEGWRNINHSYALVNQHQLRQLRKLDFELFHNDLPFFHPQWNSQANSSGFGEDSNREILSIPSLPAGSQRLDITYRISTPLRLYPSTSDQLLVFGTSEFQCLPAIFDDGRPTAENLKIVTPSHWSKTGFLKAGFEEEQILVVPHGIDPDIFSPVDKSSARNIRERLGVGEDHFVILSLGAMTGNKGIDILTRAFAVLRQRYAHVKLLLKDQSNLYGLRAHEVLDKIIRNYAHEFTDDVVSSIIVVSKNLSLKQMNELYGCADCYISPYRAEGFNLPALEAAAAGVPIIVTNGGATDDYCDPSFAMKINGRTMMNGAKTYIEPSRDSLIEQAAILIEGRNPALDPAAAAAYIRKRFTWAKVTEALVRNF